MPFRTLFRPFFLFLCKWQRPLPLTGLEQIFTFRELFDFLLLFDLFFLLGLRLLLAGTATVIFDKNQSPGLKTEYPLSLCLLQTGTIYILVEFLNLTCAPTWPLPQSCNLFPLFGPLRITFTLFFTQH